MKKIITKLSILISILICLCAIFYFDNKKAEAKYNSLVEIRDIARYLKIYTEKHDELGSLNEMYPTSLDVHGRLEKELDIRIKQYNDLADELIFRKNMYSSRIDEITCEIDQIQKVVFDLKGKNYNKAVQWTARK